MYDGRFLKAKNYKGKYYRDQINGNLIEYCAHSFIIRPVFETITEYFVGCIIEPCERLKELIGVCQFCGEVTIIRRENIVATEIKYNDKIKEILKKQKKRKNR